MFEVWFFDVRSTFNIKLLFFHQNLMKLGEVVVHIDRVLQLHQVSLHFDEKNNTFISNTFNGWSVR